jgi:hypothetical protein
MILMFWFWRCIAFIVWGGLCQAYHQRWSCVYLLLDRLSWPVRAEQDRPTAPPVALAARRAADWQSIDALLESLRDRPTGAEDQAA